MDRTTIWLYISTRSPCIFSWDCCGLIELVSYICDNDDKALILTPSYGPFKMACDKIILRRYILR